MIRETDNERQRSGGSNRRDFCKKVPCAAMGIIASSAAMAGFYNASDPAPLNHLKPDTTMANIVTAKVISQKGSCGLGHKIGDEIVFTEDGVNGKICIHALYSFLPKVFAMMYDSKFPWLEDPNVSTSACPDAYNPVVFEISRKSSI